MAVSLLSNANATGSTVSMGFGGTFMFAVQGTFGGATVKLQIQGPDGSTFMDVASASFTAAGYVAVDLPGDAAVKAVVSGGTPSALYATLARVR